MELSHFMIFRHFIATDYCETAGNNEGVYTMKLKVRHLMLVFIFNSCLRIQTSVR